MAPVPRGPAPAVAARPPRSANEVDALVERDAIVGNQGRGTVRPIGMRTTSTRARTLLAAALAGALLLAACGSDDDAEVTSEPAATEPGTDAVDPDTPVSSPPDDGTSASDPGEPVTPGDMEPIDAAEAEVLVGLTLAEAEAEAADRGWTVRTARLDGEDLALTEDFSPTRVNVAVDDDVVTEILFIG